MTVAKVVPVQAIRRASKPREAWVEGTVDKKAEHASLCYGEAQRAVALVAPHRAKGFIVQFLLKARSGDARANKILDEVRRELTFYLLDVVGPNSWPFVQYHCDTPANRLSIVHWRWYPKASDR